MSDLEQLFSQFLREKQFLSNVSPRTIKFFRWTFNVWNKHVGEVPTKANLKEFVIRLQQSGISTTTANSYIRGVNSFLTWLHENEHIPEQLRIKLLKAPQKTPIIYTDEQIKRLLSFRPKTFAEHRVYALVCLAIDTGARIAELLTLKTDCIDFDNLLIKVVGKGNKERVVPISLELRKTLFSFLKKRPDNAFDYVFCTRHGDKLSYRASLDQFKALCERVGVTGVKQGWHTLRHSFASAYVRDGGNVFYLQRILGHSDLSTTKIYVHTQTEDLTIMHRKTSLLSRLR